MPTKRRSNPPGEPQVEPEAGIRLLRTQIDKAQALLGARPLSSDAYGQWDLLTRNYLEKAFGVDSPNVSSVTNVGMFGSFPMGASAAWWENNRAEDLATKVTRLDGLVEAP